MRVLRRTLRSAVVLLLAVGFALGCANGALEMPGSGSLPPAWTQPPPAPPEGPIVTEGALHRFTLPNGLDVLLLEDHRLPRITLGLAAKRGAADVAAAKAGLSSLTAELMERGAGERSALELAQTVDELGANLSVSAGWDSTTASISGLSEDIDALVAVLSDVVRRPRFEAAEFAKTQAEQLAALARAKDEPETLIGWHLMRATYGAHRFGWPRSGVPETLAALTLSDVRDYYATSFAPGDAVLYAVGDVGPQRFRSLAASAFGGWERGRARAAVGPAPPAQVPGARKVVIVDRPDLAQARIGFAHEGLERSDARRTAAGLVNNVLGGSGFSSRLMNKLRSEAGLTYGVYSYFDLRRAPGPFVVTTFTRVPEVRRAIDMLLEEVERIRSEPPSEAELAEMKSYQTGGFGLSLETSDAVMAQLVNFEVYGMPENTLDTYRSRVRAVTIADTAKLAQELMHPERAAIVVVGPASELAPMLEGLGPIEVVEP